MADFGRRVAGREGRPALVEVVLARFRLRFVGPLDPLARHGLSAGGAAQQPGQHMDVVRVAVAERPPLRQPLLAERPCGRVHQRRGIQVDPVLLSRRDDIADLAPVGGPALVGACLVAPAGGRPFVDGVLEDAVDGAAPPELSAARGGDAVVLKLPAQALERGPSGIVFVDTSNHQSFLLNHLVRAEGLRREGAAQYVGLDDHMVAERGDGTGRLLPL